MNKFGYVREVDLRNRLHPMSAPPPLRTGTKQDYYRFWMTHKDTVLDQIGPRCTAYGLAHLLLMQPIVNAHRPEYPWDPFGAYDEARLIDGLPDYVEGTTTNAIMKVARAHGYISGWTWADNIETVCRHVLSEGPVAWGTTWYSGMSQPDADGYIHPIRVVEGGHFWVQDYVHRRWPNPDGSVGRIGMLNTWGRGWGMDGRAWMTLHEAASLLDGDGECAAPVEIKVRT